MEPSSTATEQLTAKYLQHALLANPNHNDALGPTTMPNNEKYHNASSLCYRKNTHAVKQSEQLSDFLNRTMVGKAQHICQEIREEYFLLNSNI